MFFANRREIDSREQGREAQRYIEEEEERKERQRVSESHLREWVETTKVDGIFQRVNGMFDRL